MDMIFDSADILKNLLTEKKSSSEITTEEINQLSQFMEETMNVSSIISNEIIDELELFALTSHKYEELAKNVDNYEIEIEDLKRQLENGKSNVDYDKLDEIEKENNKYSQENH